MGGASAAPEDRLMTLQARADAYASAFPKWSASHLRLVTEAGGECLYGTWMLGNNYRAKVGYYGEYPPGYLDRVTALFPDVQPIDDGRLTTMHAFSGSLPEGPYVRCDSQQPAERACSVYDLDPATTGIFDLVLADPPYSSADAEKYGSGMVDRRRAMSSLARVTRVGGHVVWLDTVWPMFRKTEWRTVGRICLVRSTNHRVRLVSIFERQAQ